MLAMTLLAITSNARAQGTASTSVAVVRVVSPADEELLERVRGQTIDLPVELRVDRTAIITSGAEPPLEEQLAAARALAASHGARIVVWFRSDPDSSHTTVFIAEPAADRVLMRRIDHGGDAAPALARSAAFEAAALVVRSSIKALAAGGRIGVETRARPAPPPPPPVPELPPAPRASVFAVAALGWTGALTDAELRGHNAVAGRIGLGRDNVQLAIDAAFGAEVAYRDDRTVVHLARHRLGVDAEYARALGVRSTLSAALGAGAVWFERATDTLDAGVMATPATRTLVPIASASLRWRYRPSRAPIALELSAGVEASARVAHFGYQLDGGFVERTTMWPVAPRLGLALFVESGQ